MYRLVIAPPRSDHPEVSHATDLRAEGAADTLDRRARIRKRIGAGFLALPLAMILGGTDELVSRLGVVALFFATLIVAGVFFTLAGYERRREMPSDPGHRDPSALAPRLMWSDDADRSPAVPGAGRRGDHA